MVLVQKYGTENWTLIANHLPGRIGKQCRERWYNHLDPNVNKEPFTEDEEKILIDAQNRLGNKWCDISSLLPGRTDNQVKNHFNSIMYHKKKGTKMKEKKKKERPRTSKSLSYPYLYSFNKTTSTPTTPTKTVTPTQNYSFTQPNQQLPIQQPQRIYSNNSFLPLGMHQVTSQNNTMSNTTATEESYDVSNDLYDEDTDLSSTFTFTETDHMTGTATPPLEMEYLNFSVDQELDSFGLFNLDELILEEEEEDQRSSKKQKQK